MFKSLRELLKDASRVRPRHQERISWIKTHAAQMVLTAWLRSLGLGGRGAPSRCPRASGSTRWAACSPSAAAQLNDLAREVAGPLDKLQRKLVALITADVHARDITETTSTTRSTRPTRSRGRCSCASSTSTSTSVAARRVLGFKGVRDGRRRRGGCTSALGARLLGGGGGGGLATVTIARPRAWSCSVFRIRLL